MYVFVYNITKYVYHREHAYDWTRKLSLKKENKDTWCYSDDSSSLIGSHKVSGTQEWVVGLAMCDLSMDLAWEVHFPNNIDMSQIVYISKLLIITFLSAQLPSYC